MTWKIWKQRRHVLTFFIFLGTLMLYMCRVNLSIAIVAMKQDRFILLENGTEINIGPEFPWSNIIQGYLLSGFFYGYTVTPIIGGTLARFTGGKMSLGLAVAGTAAFSLISPWLAQWSEYALLAGRICTGFLEGVTYPSLYILLAAWIPPAEKSRATTLIHAGNYTGTIVSMFSFGYLAEAAGWRSLFWFTGGVCIIWVFFWWRIVAESPAKDIHISEKEFNYIQESLKAHEVSKRNPIPWIKLLTAPPVWTYCAVSFCECWGFYTLVTLLPKYYKEIYDIDLSKSGVLSSLPYICLALGMIMMGHLADMIVRKKWLTETSTRKLLICLGCLIQASFLFGAAYWNNIVGTVICLVISVTGNSLTLCGSSSLPLDLSRQWSSVLYGISLTSCSLAGILSPTLAGYIVSTENPSIQEWQIIFYITVAIYVLGILIFILFGSAERLPFDRIEEANNSVSLMNKGEDVCSISSKI